MTYHSLEPFECRGFICVS